MAASPSPSSSPATAASHQPSTAAAATATATTLSPSSPTSAASPPTASSTTIAATSSSVVPETASYAPTTTAATAATSSSVFPETASSFAPFTTTPSSFSATVASHPPFTTTLPPSPSPSPSPATAAASSPPSDAYARGDTPSSPCSPEAILEADMAETKARQAHVDAASVEHRLVTDHVEEDGRDKKLSMDDVLKGFGTNAVDDEVVSHGLPPGVLPHQNPPSDHPTEQYYVFICGGNMGSGFSNHPLPALVEKSVNNIGAPFPFNTASLSSINEVNVCLFKDDTAAFSDGDVIVYPHMRIYRGLKPGEVEEFVEFVLMMKLAWRDAGGLMNSSYCFICCDTGEVLKCSMLGPVIVTMVQDEAGAQGIELYAYPSSRMGQCQESGGEMIVFKAPGDAALGKCYRVDGPDFNRFWDVLCNLLGKGADLRRLMASLPKLVFVARTEEEGGDYLMCAPAVLRELIIKVMLENLFELRATLSMVPLDIPLDWPSIVIVEFNLVVEWLYKLASQVLENARKEAAFSVVSPTAKEKEMRAAINHAVELIEMAEDLSLDVQLALGGTPYPQDEKLRRPIYGVKIVKRS